MLAGDPMQLPPLIASPAQPQQRGGAPAHGLLRPLFARLMAAGHAVHMLRRQYRCSTVLPNFSPCIASFLQWDRLCKPISCLKKTCKRLSVCFAYNLGLAHGKMCFACPPTETSDPKPHEQGRSILWEAKSRHPL